IFPACQAAALLVVVAHARRSVVEPDPLVARSKRRGKTGAGLVPALRSSCEYFSFPLPPQAVGARREPGLGFHRAGRKRVAAPMQLALVARWALAVRDKHPPAIANFSEPWILDRGGICHVGVERQPPCRGVERVGAAGLDDVDPPAPIDAVDVAHV